MGKKPVDELRSGVPHALPERDGRTSPSRRRGRAISKAVDAAQILTKKFVPDVTVKSIELGTELVKSLDSGDDQRRQLDGNPPLEVSLRPRGRDRGFVEVLSRPKFLYWMKLTGFLVILPLRIPICAFDAKTGILCGKCQAKLTAGQITEADIQVSRALVKLAEKIQDVNKMTLLRSFHVDGKLRPRGRAVGRRHRQVQARDKAEAGGAAQGQGLGHSGLELRQEVPRGPVLSDKAPHGQHRLASRREQADQGDNPRPEGRAALGRDRDPQEDSEAGEGHRAHGRVRARSDRAALKITANGTSVPRVAAFLGPSGRERPPSRSRC